MSIFTVRLRRASAVGGAAAAATAAVLVGAGPAAAVIPPGTYHVSSTAGASFQLLTSNNLITTTTDDAVFRLSTSSAGPFRMPFAVTVYNKRLSAMTVSSNGNIQFSTLTTTSWTNTCLPSSAFPGRTLMPFWDDLYMNPNDTSETYTEGIFTKASGVSPHRKFIVSWQGHAFSSEAVHVLVQVVFSEGSQNIQYVYGSNGADPAVGNSATIGAQASGSGPVTQYACGPTTPPTLPVFSGLRVTLIHSG